MLYKTNAEPPKELTLDKQLFSDITEGLDIIATEIYPLPEKVVPIKFITYIRTDRSNRLITTLFGFCAVAESVDYKCEVYPNILIDTVFICGKSLIESAFDIAPEIKDIFYSNTMCFPVSVLYDPGTSSYYVISNVIVSDDIIRREGVTIKEPFYWVDISDCTPLNYIEQEVMKTVVIVDNKKEGEANE